jgi:hypothetical protein
MHVPGHHADDEALSSTMDPPLWSGFHEMMDLFLAAYSSRMMQYGTRTASCLSPYRLSFSLSIRV